MEMTFARECSVLVVTLAAAAEVLDQTVDQHVAGAGVEGQEVLWFGVGGDDGEVGDTANVEADAAEFAVTVERVVGKGDERGALATEGDVGGTEIGDGSDAGEVGDDGAVTELERGSGFCSEEICW